MLYHQIVYHLRAVEAAGFRVAILVSGHAGGFVPDMKLIAHIYSLRRPLRTCALADSEVITYKKYPQGHAGPGETSQLWALRPEMVDISRMPGEPIEGRLFATDESARMSSRREGEKVVESQIHMLKRITDKLLEDAGNQPKSDRLTFEETEEIWKEVLAEKPRWAALHPLENFGRYMEERTKLFPLPVALGK